MTTHILATLAFSTGLALTGCSSTGLTSPSAPDAYGNDPAGGTGGNSGLGGVGHGAGGAGGEGVGGAGVGGGWTAASGGATVLGGGLDAGGSGMNAAPNCPRTGNPSSPSKICAVRCASGSDISVSIDALSPPTASASPIFAAHVSQSNPQPCDQTFVNVQASWSGEFMNYSGQNSQWQFNLLATVGSPLFGGGDANVEVYPIGTSMISGPVNVGSTLLCTIYTF